MQLIDELAMIYTVLISLFATFSYDRSPWLQWSIFAALATTGVTITSVYHYLHEPLFHQNAFALLMITLLGNGFYKTETLVKYTNPKARILIWQIVGWGSVVFLSAFALWNVDNAYCTELRRMRRSIGMPWGFLLGIFPQPRPTPKERHTLHNLPPPSLRRVSTIHSSRHPIFLFEKKKMKKETY